MTQTEQFEINKKDFTKEQLKQLKSLIKKQVLSNKEVSFKEEKGNLYLIDGKKNILIEDKQLKQDIENIRNQEQKEKLKTIKKTQQQLGQKKQEVSSNVDLPSQNIETLEKLYNDKDFPKKVILDLIKEKLSKASFDEKIKFLKRNKDKGLELFYYGLIEIIKSVKGKEQANEIIQTVGKEQIQKAVKEYILIDDSFAEDYWFYYNSDRFSVSCEGKNVSMETCKSVGAYVWALGGGVKQGVDMNSMSYILFESFGKDISDFANTIETGIRSYEKLKGTLPDESKEILKKEGAIGLLRRTLSKTPMSESKKEFWTGMAQIGVMVGVIWGLIKIIKKNGFSGVIGLIAGEFALEAWSGDTSLDLLNKLLYGGFDLDKLSKKGLKKGKENKEYAKLIGHPSLINALVGNMKASELKKYCKFENGKIVSFDIKKYSDSLGKNDWRKALLEKIGVDKAGKIFVLGLSQMGLKSENDFGDKKVGAVYKKYLEGIEEKAKQNQASSIGTQIGTLANGSGTASSAGGAATTTLVNGGTDKQADKQTKTVEITPEQKKEIIKYFQFSGKELNNLENKLKHNGLNFDIPNFLNSYKVFIESNLKGLKKEYKDKIKLSIKNNILKLSSVVDDRIAFVDKKIKNGDYKKEDRAKEIRNQRWIINAKMQELFSDMNNKILPSVEVYLKYKDKVAKGYKFLIHDETLYNVTDKIKETEKMLNSNVLENGDFDKTWKSFEIMDSFTNNWDIFDASMEHATFTNGGIDGDFLKRKKIKVMKGETLLSKEDIEIEKNAQAFYIAYAMVSVIPYIGLAASIPSDIADTFSDQEGVITILKKLGVVDKNYTMEKSYWDNIFGGVGIILSFLGLQGIAREKKLVKAGTILDKIGIGRVENAMVILGKKLGISKDKLNKVTSKFKKFKGKKPELDVEKTSGENKTTKVEEKVGTKTTGAPFKAPESKVVKVKNFSEKTYENITQINNEMKNIGEELTKRAELNDYYDPKFRKQRIGEIQKEIETLKIKQIKIKYNDLLNDKNIKKILEDIKIKKTELKNTPEKSSIVDVNGNPIDNTLKIEKLKKDIKKLKEQLYEELSKKVFIKEREDLKNSLSTTSKKDNLLKIGALQKKQRVLLYKKQVLSKPEIQRNIEKADSDNIIESLMNTFKSVKNKLFSGLKITKNDFETPYKIELNGKDIEIGYDKSTEKYFVKEGKNTMEFNNKKNLNTYLEQNSDIKSKLEEEHLLRKFNESYKKEGLYKEEITGTNYLKGKEFNIDGKDYIVVKTEKKDEFYVVEKDGNTFKLNEKKSVDDFIKEHPEFVENYVKLVDTLYAKAFEKMKNVKISSLSEGTQNKILKALGKPASWIKDKTIGNLLKGLGDIKSGVWKNWTSKEKGLISKGVDTALIPITWALTGKINPTIGEGFESMLKGLVILGGVYSVEYGMQNHDDNWYYVIGDSILHGYKDKLFDGLVVEPIHGNYDVLIDYILWTRTAVLAGVYDYYKYSKGNENISSK